MNRWIRYILVGILIFGLILVRRFETVLFYDPFLSYFKGDIFNAKFPQYDLTKVSIHIIFRYFLNSLLTLGIIGLLFWDLKKVKFTAYILLSFLVVLLPIYLYLIEIQFSLGSNVGFYVRRFLIQPLLLLILIPAFYYQIYQNQNKD